MKGLDAEKTAPFRFDRGPTACLLIHGFTGSPCVMRGLGEYLAERDLTVVCNRLPGHGTTPRAMLGTSWHDWYSACVEDLAALSSRSERVFLCGLSMGGTLGLHLAAHHADRCKVAGVVTYAAPVYMENPLFALIPLVKGFVKFKKTTPVDVANREAIDQVQSYGHVPIRCVESLLQLLRHVKDDLRDIKTPTLLMQGRVDHVVAPPNVHLIHRLLGSDDKQVLQLENSYHILPVDHDKELVMQSTYEFIRRTANLE